LPPESRLDLFRIEFSDRYFQLHREPLQLILTGGQPVFLLERLAVIVVPVGVKPEYPARISRAKAEGIFLRQQGFSIAAEAAQLGGALTVDPTDETDAIGGQFCMEVPKFLAAANTP
jgi:hypothetical protein